MGMTYDSIYWLIMGIGFVLTGVVGIGVMLKTRRLGASFIAGSAVNTLVFAAAGIWWAQVFSSPEDSFSLMFGLFGFGIAFVNNEVLLFFAQLIMRNRM